MKDTGVTKALIAVLCIIVGWYGYQEYNKNDQSTYERVSVVYVVDGDSFFVMRNLGTDNAYQDEIRLHGLNAPETHGYDNKEGDKSHKALAYLISDRNILLKDFDGHRGKYDRLIAIAYVVQNQDTININEYLVHNGYAKPRDYGLGAIN